MINMLAFGDAVPSGKSVYVLRKKVKGGSIELWDPITGTCYFFGLKYELDKFNNN